MRIYIHNLFIKVGRRLNIRQIALASGEIYLTRFLTRVSLKEVNIYLLVTTCLYVACKIEECPQHIRLILSEARSIWPEYIPSDISKLAEFEFYLIEEMDSYLILHHPYKSLIQIRDYLDLNYGKFGIKLTQETMQNSWSLINDSYITDIHLLLPPHIIAVSAIYITIVLKKNLLQLKNLNENGQNNNTKDEMNIDDLMSLNGIQKNNKKKSNNNNENGNDDFELDILDEDTIKINKFMNFLEHSHINLDEIVEAVQDMMNVYLVWNRYNEQTVKKQLQAMLLNKI
ncbi:unnamed protein product [Candida verbasci]|uniref:Cyclin-like domain-containing protein n=1 Tax=Candida verbasci TaxID=1227364 RepID=A0A9W4XA78_9ASCO|nr:unnamed protein product [Candida verbasci]